MNVTPRTPLSPHSPSSPSPPSPTTSNQQPHQEQHEPQQTNQYSPHLSPQNLTEYHLSISLRGAEVKISRLGREVRELKGRVREAERGWRECRNLVKLREVGADCSTQTDPPPSVQSPPTHPQRPSPLAHSYTEDVDIEDIGHYDHGGGGAGNEHGGGGAGSEDCQENDVVSGIQEHDGNKDCQENDVVSGIQEHDGKDSKETNESYECNESEYPSDELAAARAEISRLKSFLHEQQKAHGKTIKVLEEERNLRIALEMKKNEENDKPHSVVSTEMQDRGVGTSLLVPAEDPVIPSPPRIVQTTVETPKKSNSSPPTSIVSVLSTNLTTRLAASIRRRIERQAEKEVSLIRRAVERCFKVLSPPRKAEARLDVPLTKAPAKAKTKIKNSVTRREKQDKTSSTMSMRPGTKTKVKMMRKKKLPWKVCDTYHTRTPSPKVGKGPAAK